MADDKEPVTIKAFLQTETDIVAKKVYDQIGLRASARNNYTRLRRILVRI